MVKLKSSTFGTMMKALMNTETIELKFNKRQYNNFSVYYASL